MAYAEPVVAVKTSANVNIAAPGGGAWDGVSTAGFVNGTTRLLLVDQTATPSENGVWIWQGTGAALQRPGGSDQYKSGNTLDNATLIPVASGDALAGTVWGIDPAKIVIVDTTSHTLTRVALPPVQCRVATTEHINLANTILIIDPKVVRDAMMEDTVAPTILTCPVSKPFTPADVGKPIVVMGADAPDDLATTIAGYTSASEVTLTAGCTSSIATRLTDGVMNVGANATRLTSASAPFALTDEGKTIVVYGAGPEGTDLVTTIKTYTNSSEVELMTACGASVAAAVVLFGSTTARYAVALHGNGQAGSDIVLVKNQATVVPIDFPTAAPEQNGLYWANTGNPMMRCSEPLTPGRAVVVSEGTANAHKRFELVTQGPITPETTPITFASQNPVFDVCDYGAIPDWDWTTGTGTDNLGAFLATLAAAKTDLGISSSNKTATIVANGAFYLGGTLDIEQTIHLEGQGMQEPTAHTTRGMPGAWLVFPPNTTGIRIHSTEADDGGGGRTAMLTQAGDVTTLTRGESFASASVGRPITISGSATPANNGTFTITAVIDSTSVSWTNAGGAPDAGVSGVTASLLQSGDVTTLTGGAGLTPDMNYGFITISGSSIPENNGTFLIDHYNDGSSVAWTNVSGATDPSGAVAFEVGTVGFTLGGGFGDASKTTIRNLTISCKEPFDPVTNNTGHGVHATATFTLVNVTIQQFGLDGVHANGHFLNQQDGNVDASVLTNVWVGVCGRDGFHFRGGDANECNLFSCTSNLNGRFGFADIITFGNVYIGCTSQGNAENYHTQGDVNRSTFLACYSEDGPLMSMYGQASVYGGNLTNETVTEHSPVHIQSWGTVGRTPLIYRNTRGPTVINYGFGAFNPGAPEAMDAFEWKTEAPLDYSRLRYTDDELSPLHRWWTLENASYYRAVMRFPTTQTYVRSPAPWMPNGLYLGDMEFGQTLFVAATAPPDKRNIGLPQTYERGDVVWQSAPVAGGALGQVCLTRGTRTKLRDIATTGTIAPFSADLTLDVPAGFAVDQYVTIGGLGVFQITLLVGDTATVIPSTGAAGAMNEPVDVVMVGTIANGSPHLTVDDGAGLDVGQYITIAGVGGGSPDRLIVGLGTRATIECVNPGDYSFSIGDTLVVLIDRGPAQTVTFEAGDFPNFAVVPVGTLVAKLASVLTHCDVTATPSDTVEITSHTIGADSYVTVLGGTANVVLAFPDGEASGTADATKVTLATPADANATDAVVALSPPVFGQFGRVESLGTTIDPTIDPYPAAAGEHIALSPAWQIGGGTAVGLPAAPNSDDEVQVINMSGANVIVDAGANPIYGAGGTTDTLADDGATTYRWVAVPTPAWKRI